MSAIATVISNCIVLYVFHKHRSLLRIPSNLFILNLAIIDLLNGLFRDTFNGVSWLNNGWTFGEPLCRFNGFMQTICYVVTIFTLLATGICRYLVIVHSYGKVITRKVVLIIIGCIWIYSILDSLMPIFGWNRYIFQPLEFSCLPDWLSVSGASYVMFALIADTIIPSILIGLCYIVIYIVIARNAKRMANRFHIEHSNNVIPSIGNSVDYSVANTPENDRNRQARAKWSNGNTLGRKEVKITRAMFSVYVIFLACYLPYALTIFIIAPAGGNVSHNIIFMVGYLVNVNSAINPFFYGVIYRQFRKAYIELFCCCGLSAVSVKFPTSRSRHRHLLNSTPIIDRKNRVDVLRDGMTDASTSNL
ncbi:uncharacterized protein TRIADDRAFT_58578 [Trichoplax adhaerens]|uniref:G-protein coupled receptors family 1 profile domain-containing protein n=1 Tax=Trichoplax adhaerens TaxID=10228 RepID=B3S333_TRIAD|nr:hypothetical protein TRIADDRAFT_58578 [Trichoplax adhaerens]EDV22896.1 hypothetical protein TRIADDRAFT_58578 [Trichoplax adhaerens]|eukprot:XP_002114762.1 hypothetical protein TRIADDRAFT_58578 [Trichoplax adhaerens]